MPEGLSAGTELKLTVGDTTESFVSPDRVPHTIYETLSAGEASARLNSWWPAMRSRS